MFIMRLWPLRRDERSGVLIGAGGMRRSDWPELMSENRSIKRVQGLAAVCTQLLHIHKKPSGGQRSNDKTFLDQLFFPRRVVWLFVF